MGQKPDDEVTKRSYQQVRPAFVRAAYAALQGLNELDGLIDEVQRTVTSLPPAVLAAAQSSTPPPPDDPAAHPGYPRLPLVTEDDLEGEDNEQNSDTDPEPSV